MHTCCLFVGSIMKLHGARCMIPNKGT
jgi:hypothetical protein